MKDESLTPEQQMRRLSRRSFVWSAVTVSATIGVWRWVATRPYEPIPGSPQGVPGPLRQVLEANGRISSAWASNGRLLETYPRSAVQPIRTNGRHGLHSEVPADYRLRVEGLGSGRALALGDVMALPRAEVVTKFKCIEGWSRVVQAAGCRFSDLIAHLQDPGAGRAWNESRLSELPPYASLETPDGEYYVGMDMKTLLHPQTLVAWEMNGEPLRPENGAPLRLYAPTKYGIKSLKRIGLIRFSSERPTDFWYEAGYDWHAGH